MKLAAQPASTAALGLFAAGAVWPTTLCALTALAASPYERLLATAWCGGPPHAANALLGHCPACWAGAAAFFIAGVLALFAPRLGVVSLRARR